MHENSAFVNAESDDEDMYMSYSEAENVPGAGSASGSHPASMKSPLQSSSFSVSDRAVPSHPVALSTVIEPSLIPTHAAIPYNIDDPDIGTIEPEEEDEFFPTTLPIFELPRHPHQVVFTEDARPLHCYIVEYAVYEYPQGIRAEQLGVDTPMPREALPYIVSNTPPVPHQPAAAAAGRPIPPIDEILARYVRPELTAAEKLARAALPTFSYVGDTPTP